MLPARCRGCGSALEAVRAAELDCPPAAPSGARSAAARALAVTLAIALVAAAFNAGLQSGGLALAIVGASLMVFALLPFFRRH